MHHVGIMDKLSFLTCNTHGLADHYKHSDALRFLFGKGANVLFPQETHATPVDLQLWKYAACSDGVYHSYGADARTGGVSIVIDQHTDHQVHSIKKD